MTPQQKKNIENAWKKKEATGKQLQNSVDKWTKGCLAKLPQDEIDKRYDDMEKARKADDAALEDVAEALRATGVSI